MRDLDALVSRTSQSIPLTTYGTFIGSKEDDAKTRKSEEFVENAGIPTNSNKVTDIRFIRSVLTRAMTISLPIWMMEESEAILIVIAIALIGNYGSETDVAACGLALSFYRLTAYFMVEGLAAALDTLTPQALGAQKYKLVGVYCQRAILIVMFLAVIPISIIWYFSTPILLGLGQHDSVVNGISSFLYLRFPGLIFLVVTVCVSKCLIAMGKAFIIGIIFTVASVFCAMLSWIFIAYFHWGVEGFALALTIVEVLQTIALIIVAKCDFMIMKCWPGWGWHSVRGWHPFLKLSIPGMVMLNVEMASWEIIPFLAGLVSPGALAAQTVLSNLVEIVNFIPSSFSIACAVLVGNELGRHNPIAAQRTGFIFLIFSIIVTGMLIGVMVLFRRPLASLFGGHGIINTVSALMPLIGIFSFIDSIQMLLTGVVNGTGQQRFFAPIIFFCYWLVGIPMSILMSFHFHKGLVGLWYGMLLAVILHTFSYAWMLKMYVSFPKAAEEATRRLASSRYSSSHHVPSIELTVEHPLISNKSSTLRKNELIYFEKVSFQDS